MDFGADGKIARPEVVKDEHLTFLDDIRKSAVVNMYQADAFLRVKFGLNYEDSNKVLTYWMISFGREDR